MKREPQRPRRPHIELLALFTKAIQAKHPEIRLVSDAGPSPEDERYHFLWPKLRELKADIVDERCYANPIWFLSNSDCYDRFDRNGPKVFFGEYAAQSVTIGSPKNRNHLECALAEAAYMTGLERNADVVRMASYAPLFARADAWQWKPDLIWTDNFNVLAMPSYYVQQLFCRNLRVCHGITDPLRRERRAGRCQAPRRRRCGDIVEERQRRGCPPAAAPRRAAGSRTSYFISYPLRWFGIGQPGSKM